MDGAILVNGLVHPAYLAYQSEESGGEVDGAVLVNGLVHPDELLEGQPVRALAPEAQGRVHVLQHVVHLRVVDPAPGKHNSM